MTLCACVMLVPASVRKYSTYNVVYKLFLEWFNELVTIVEEITGTTYNYSSEQLGCSPYDRPFYEGIAEIAEWMNQEGNQQELVFLFINDEPNWSYGHADEIVGPMVQYFNSRIFTPEDKANLFPQRWPTMYSHGLRVFILIDY
jgi:hypothetical protein